MEQPESDADLRALRNIRRHLTVVFLAVEHLCRTFASLPPAQRLCSFATDALTSVRDEVAAIEERIFRRERRAQHLPDEFSERPPDL